PRLILFFLFTYAPTTEIYTLSLHDALPIYISDTVRYNIVGTVIVLAVVIVSFVIFIKTKFGRHVWDKFKLKMPVLGPVISKVARSEEHTSELQSRENLVCRLLLEKKKHNNN